MRTRIAIASLAVTLSALSLGLAPVEGSGQTQDQQQRQAESFPLFTLPADTVLREPRSETRSVILTQRELDAMQTLLHLDRALIRVDKRKGTLTPTPQILFMGFPAQEFDIPLTTALQVVDLNFQDINSIDSVVKFVGQELELRIRFEDEGKEIVSRLGSIDLADFSAFARIRVISKADGGQDLSVGDCGIDAKITGTGLLKGKAVIERLHKLANDTVRKELTRNLESSRVRAQIGSALLQWARFSTGEAYTGITPGSLKIQSGILSYTVNR